MVWWFLLLILIQSEKTVQCDSFRLPYILFAEKALNAQYISVTCQFKFVTGFSVYYVTLARNRFISIMEVTGHLHRVSSTDGQDLHSFVKCLIKQGQIDMICALLMLERQPKFAEVMRCQYSGGIIHLSRLQKRMARKTVVLLKYPQRLQANPNYQLP